MYFADRSIVYVSDSDSLKNKYSARTNIDSVLETSTVRILLKEVWEPIIIGN